MFIRTSEILGRIISSGLVCLRIYVLVQCFSDSHYENKSIRRAVDYHMVTVEAYLRVKILLIRERRLRLPQSCQLQ
jgi:hypothetical protein